VLWRLRTVWPGGLAAWVAFLALLAPVASVRHAGFQMMADRYSYLPCLGWAILVGAAVGAGAREWQRRSLPRMVGGLVVGALAAGFLCLGALTWQQARTWRDSETLWRHALSVEPTCSICHAQLAGWLLQQKRPGEALAHYEACLALRPDRVRMRIG